MNEPMNKDWSITELSEFCLEKGVFINFKMQPNTLTELTGHTRPVGNTTHKK